MPKKTINVGDRVVIKNRGGGWNGVTGVVEKIGTSDNYAPYHIRYDDPASTPLGLAWAGGDWSRQYLKLASSRLLDLMQQVEHLEAEVERARRSESIEVERTTALIREKTAAEIEVEDLKATLHEAVERITRSGAAYDRLKASANGEIDRMKREISYFEGELERVNKARVEETAPLYTEINEAHAALEYAFTLLNQRGRNRLAGFRNGYATRVNED